MKLTESDFNDPRRCDGVRNAISLQPRPCCIPCRLRIEPTPRSVQWIKPAAYKADDGAWSCTTLEGIHESHRAPLAALAATLDLGKAGTTAGAGDSTISAGGRAA